MGNISYIFTKEEEFSWQKAKAQGDIAEKEKDGEKAKRGKIFRAKEERFSCEGEILVSKTR